MVFLFTLFIASLSYKLTYVPESVSPPSKTTQSSAVFNSKTNEIITIGGLSSELSPKIYIFNLFSKTFKKIDPQSHTEPPYLSGHRLFLSDSLKIYTFGSSSEIYSFNLKTSSWSIESFSGDSLKSRRFFGFDSFSFKNSKFVGIFGGQSDEGYLSDFIMVDIENLKIIEPETFGDKPSAMIGCSLSYHEESLYLYGYSPFEDKENSLYRLDLISMTWSVILTTGQKPLPCAHHYSKVIKNSLFVVFGFHYESLSQYSSIYKLDLITFNWTCLSFESNFSMFESAEVFIGSTLYLFYGKSGENTLNSVISIDLDKSILTANVLANDFDSPVSRMHHCSVVIDRYMYTFAGSHLVSFDHEELLGDLWRFDFDLKVWNIVHTSGHSPENRKNFACCKMNGDVLAVFGGIGLNGFLHDFYYFHESFKVWHQTSENKIEPRADSCMTYSKHFYFIIGGRDGQKGFNDIWTYNVETCTFDLFLPKMKNPLKDLHGSICWVETFSNSSSILIQGGSNFKKEPNPFTFEIHLDVNMKFLKMQINNSETPDKSPLILSTYSSSTRIHDSLLVLGGLLSDSMMIFPPRIKNLKTNNFSNLSLSNSLNLFGHSAVHFEKSLFIFGGQQSSGSFKSLLKMNSCLIKVDFEELDLSCSEGHVGKNCEACPAGTFETGGFCEKCPKGTFSEVVAASDIQQCLPCPFGSYASEEGSSKCLECSFASVCFIGSDSQKEVLWLPGNSSKQPGDYQDSKKMISKMNEILSYALVSVCLFCAFVVYFSGKVWRFMQGFDIFISQHSYLIGVPVILRKTRIGGFFTILFVLFAFFTLTEAVLLYVFDNVREIKEMVPAAILDCEVFSDKIELWAGFMFYGGSCTVNSECIKEISIKESGFHYKTKTISCISTESHCFIKLLYSKVSLLKKTSSINITLKEPLSFASALTLNISSSSSIPSENSSISYSLKPTDNDTILRGSKPSLFSFELIPTVPTIQVFHSESSSWANQLTGFHIFSSQDPVLGSLATQESMNLDFHLLLQVKLINSDSGLIIKRILNQSVFNFLAAILGSVFGLMGTFAVLMGMAESLSEKFEAKQSKSARFEKMKQKKIILTSQLEKKRKILGKSLKIMPVDNHDESTIVTQWTVV